MLFIFIVFVSVFLLVFLFSKPNIGERRPRLMNMYSSVLSDMNIDYRDTKIGVQNIRDISASIVHLSEETQETAKQISGEKVEDQKWLVDLVCEFSRELDLWMRRHASEMEIMIDHLADTLNESPTLDLMTARLQTQVDTINQARTRI